MGNTGTTASEQPVISVEGCHTIRLGHRRVVECRIHEVLQRVGVPILRHDGLANMNDLGRIRTKTVNAKNL